MNEKKIKELNSRSNKIFLEKGIVLCEILNFNVLEFFQEFLGIF